MTTSPRAILVRAPNWLGDAIMAAPVYEGLRALLPNARIDLLIKEAYEGLGRLYPCVTNTYSLPADKKERKAAFRALKVNQYDTALILPNSFRSAVEMIGLAIPNRIGYSGEFRSLLLTEAIPRPRPHALHQSNYFIRLAERGFGDFHPVTPKIVIPEKSQAEADALLPKTDKPIVGVGFGATYGAAKMWPPERYAAVIDALADEATVILVGAPSDAAVERSVMERCESEPLSLVGKSSLPTLAAIIKKMSVYLTNDTGPMHLAAAVGTPVVAIFGPTDPEESAPQGKNVIKLLRKENPAPPCAPCWKRACPINHTCMTAIEPARVIAAVRDVVERRTMGAAIEGK